MKVVVIDYGLGNLGSIANIVKKVGGTPVISDNPKDIESAEKLILPGVGAFDNGMRNLNDSGLKSVIENKVMIEETPILGICLGMQLMTNSSEEGVLDGLGWIDAITVKFDFSSHEVMPRVPHMGWNTISKKKPHKMVEGFDESSSRFYFVHSYYVKCNNEQDILLTCNYHQSFAASFQKNNIIGVQFHPEKSHKYGAIMFKNFLAL